MADTAILLAAGSGRRMEGAVDDKVLAILGQQPVLAYSIDAFLQLKNLERICIVYRDEEQLQRIQALVSDLPAVDTAVDFTYVQGGKERQDSVLAALEAMPESDDLVFIHDGARPMISPASVTRLQEAAQKHGSACAARKVTDTIKRAQVRDGIPSLDDLPRDELRAMETPQVFQHRTILQAYRKVREENLKVTDDAAAAAQLGIVPHLLDLDGPNPKITTAKDLDLVEYLLLGRDRSNQVTNNMRIGFGYDIHRLVPGRRLVLGGVDIPHDKGLEGHSDADCLSHAIADAILGAAGLRDIGFYFPPGRPETAGIDSLKIIEKAVDEAAILGLKVGNIDCTLIAQEPRIAPHIDAMKERLSAALRIPPSHIGIKATTNEGVGGLGRSEGIAAHAVCLLTAK